MSIPRKSVLGEPVHDAELEGLLEALPDRELTEAELATQRANFVFGNAPEKSGVTKESARHAASSVLI
jgi:hypothetical protein